MVRIETADFTNPNSAYHLHQAPPCALKVKAQISLRELIEDIHAIGDYFKLMTDAVAGLKLQQQIRQEQAEAVFTDSDHLPEAVNDLFQYKQGLSSATNPLPVPSDATSVRSGGLGGSVKLGASDSSKNRDKATGHSPPRSVASNK